MNALKKPFCFLLLGFLVFSVDQPMDDNLNIAANANQKSSNCTSKPHLYDFTFETISSAVKTLSGKIENVLQKKNDHLYNLAFMTTGFDEPQTKKIFFLLSQDNLEIEGNLVFTDTLNRENTGVFVPHKQDESNLQITYAMPDRQIKRTSNSGSFKITNLKINENSSGLIVPVSFKVEFQGDFTCPNKLEKAQLLGISGFIEINPLEESLIAIR